MAYCLCDTVDFYLSLNIFEWSRILLCVICSGSERVGVCVYFKKCWHLEHLTEGYLGKYWYFNIPERLELKILKMHTNDIINKLKHKAPLKCIFYPCIIPPLTYIKYVYIYGLLLNCQILLCMFISVKIPHCFNYRSFKIRFDIRKRKFSHLSFIQSS